MKTKMIRATWATVIVAGLTGCGPREVEMPEVVRPVVTMVAPEPGLPRQRTFSGTAKAALETLLSFRVSGEIRQLAAKTGVSVKEGDLIAHLDETDYSIQVKQTEAQLAQAEAQLKQTKSEYERIRQLYESRNVSKSDLDAVKAAHESALAQRDAALKGLELARQQLEYCTLRSPLGGSIASVPVEAHQTVQAGQTIATLSSGEEVDVEIGVPEILIAEVAVGDAAEVTFEAVADTTFSATVSQVGVELSQSSTYPIKVKLSGADTRIRPGMTAEVTLKFATENENAIYVPVVAVVGAADGSNHLWIFDDASQSVQRRVVTVGDLTPDGLQIMAGLDQGERIVIRGVHRLQDGMRVKLLGE